MGLFKKKEIKLASEVVADLTTEDKQEAEKLADSLPPENAQNMMVEFSKASMKIQPTMINPFVTKDKKRKALSDMVNGLREPVFVSFLPQIISIINMKKEECQIYKDTNTQTDFICSWLSRMKTQRDYLYEVVKEQRTKFGFKI